MTYRILSLDGGGTLTLGSGAVEDNAALVFNRSNALTVSTAISGTGSLTQAGGGTLVLTGANGYGTTTVSAGTLQVGGGGTTGTLAGTPRPILPLPEALARIQADADKNIRRFKLLDEAQQEA